VISSLPETSVLKVALRDGVIRASIDDPATRNALGAKLMDDLEALLQATRDDRSVRAIVLEGAEGRFCAGGNLKGFSNTSPVARGPDPMREESIRGGRLFHALFSHPMLVIALVDGPAMGGGFGLACCADIVVTTPNARFALSETTLGVVPAQIAPLVVSKIGLAAARRLALTGGRLDGAQAARVGLSDFHCDGSAEAEAVVQDLLAQVHRCAPEANAATKRLLLNLDTRDVEAMIALAADVFLDRLRSPEGQEGVAAFLGKRSPSWAGGA